MRLSTRLILSSFLLSGAGLEVSETEDNADALSMACDARDEIDSLNLDNSNPKESEGEEGGLICESQKNSPVGELSARKEMGHPLKTVDEFKYRGHLFKVIQANSQKVSLNDFAEADDNQNVVVEFRVSMQLGLGENAQEFRDELFAAFNSEDGWQAAGADFVNVSHFTEDPSHPKVNVLLAHPLDMSHLCKPLNVGESLSCRMGNKAIINFYRWQNAPEAWEGDLTEYRRYLARHEVGHVLHQRHTVPGRGCDEASVMVQQTEGLNGCKRPSSRPNKSEIKGLRRYLRSFKRRFFGTESTRT